MPFSLCAAWRGDQFQLSSNKVLPACFGYEGVKQTKVEGREGGERGGVLDKRAGLCMDFEQSCVLSGLAKEKCLTSIKRHK